MDKNCNEKQRIQQGSDRTEFADEISSTSGKPDSSSRTTTGKGSDKKQQKNS